MLISYQYQIDQIFARKPFVLRMTCKRHKTCYTIMRRNNGAIGGMYVCTCNGVRERDVEAAIAAGARKPKAVHSACGVSPQCCRCLPEIAERIRKSEAIASTFNVLTEAV